MKYLPKETCEYLVSLGCVSESGWSYNGIDGELYPYKPSVPAYWPAFSLEDILRKDNAEKIWGKTWLEDTVEVLAWFQNYPNTWPEEVAKIINT